MGSKAGRQREFDATFLDVVDNCLRQVFGEKTGVRRFKVATGEIREYPVGEAYIEIEGLGATSLVVFEPEEATFLL